MGSYALTRTRRGLRALLDIVRPRAPVLRDGRDTTVGPDELVVGDHSRVRPGARVATDGIIRSGRSALGLLRDHRRAAPVERSAGDEVYAAAINGGAALEVEVTSRTEDNSLARIVKIVEEAQERKGQSQRLAERIARPLVPGVMVAAFLTALIGVCSVIRRPGSSARSSCLWQRRRARSRSRCR